MTDFSAHTLSLSLSLSLSLAVPTVTILDAATDKVTAPSPIAIDCMAFGRPVSNITWFLNDIEISDNDNSISE